MSTADVCNQCWGSGDATYPWPDHRAAERARAARERIAELEARYTDSVVHYRNLALELGAKPKHMLNKFDKDLAEKWGRGQGYEASDQIENSEEAWDTVERVTAENEQLRTVADIAVAELLRVTAELANVTAERDKWRDYFGCDSPHDCFLGANSKFDPDRIIGKEQARANRAENQLKEMRAEFDAARKLAESLGVRGQTEDHDYLCIKSRELI